jgi:hypothetical protein
MAELTGRVPADNVTCPVCKLECDRNIYSHCPRDSTNLWELDRVVVRDPSGGAPVHPAPDASIKTFLESDCGAGEGIDILVCGRRLSVKSGQVLRLGRQDDLETADVFAGRNNVSRLHAELRFDGARLYVKDTHSSNGTYVGDRELPADTEYELRPGQTLRLASNIPVEIQWRT